MDLLFTKYYRTRRYITLTDTIVLALHGARVQGALKTYPDQPAHLRANDGNGS